MCKVNVMWVLGILLVAVNVKAQNHPQFIRPFELGISHQKTTNLIFPFEIKSVDRGSSAILVQKAKGVNNILQIKADTANFLSTNLTVITSDARFYSFVLHFAEDPTYLNLRFEDSLENSHPAAMLENALVNEKSYQNLIAWTCRQRPFLRKRKQVNRIRLSLRNIFIMDSVLVFALQLSNTSEFPFRPSGVKFYIKTGGKGKRTINQERQIAPLYPPNLPPAIRDTIQVMAVGFTPFTFYESQQLIIQVEEAEGRMIRLPVKLKTLLKARSFVPFQKNSW